MAITKCLFFTDKTPLNDLFNKAIPTDMWAYYFENISLIIYKTFG